MLFLVDVILVLAFVLFISSVLLREVPSKKIYLIAVFLIGYAVVVGTAEILGLVYLLANALAWLVVHAVLLVIGVFVWRRAGSPPPFGPWSDLRLRQLNPFRYFKQEPAMQLLLLGVIATYGLGLILIITIPPNNWDSMSYHLSKVGFWLQNSTLFPWATYNPRQTTFPINAEIGNLWSVVFTSGEHFIAFPQWVSALVSMVAIVGLTRQLGFSRKAANFAALIWATFPIVVFESTTTQNDLVLAGFFLSGLYLFYEGLHRSNRTLLFLSALGIGLAFGTKSTIFFLLPGLALAVLLPALRQQKFNLLVIWGVSCVVTVLLFGSFIYITNLVAYDNVLGDSDMVGDHMAIASSRLELLRDNVFRYVYQMVDLPVPAPYALPVQAVKAAIAKPVAALLGSPVFEEIDNTDIVSLQEVYGQIDEDRAWFGPLGFLLLLPAMVYGLYSGVKKRDFYRLGLVLIALCFLLAHSMAQPWTPFKGRYYVTFAAVGAPLMAVVMRPGLRFRLLRMLLVVVAISMMLIVALSNPNKPLYLDGKSVLNKSLLELRSMGVGRVGIEEYLTLIEQVPSDEPIGVMLTDGNYAWDYPLFLPGFERTVVPLVYDGSIDSLETLAEQTSIHMLVLDQEQVLTDRPLNYLVLGSIFVPEFDTSGFRAVSDGYIFTFFIREDMP